MEKRKNKKKSTLLLLLLLLVGISIGYAALTSNLNINGNTKIKKAEWDVHFENLVKSEGSESADKEATIDSSKTLIEYTVKLPEPGDFYEFTVDIVNKGSIDAMVSEVLKTGLTADQAKYIEYTATHTSGKELKQYDSLKAGQTRKIKVRVKYRDDLNPEDLPTEDKSIDLSLQVTYVQVDEKVTKTTPSIMAAGRLKANVDSSKITKIEFKVDEEIPTTAIDSWDVSQDQDKSVMAYAEDDKTGNGTYKVTIVGDGNVTANENSSAMFAGFSNLKEIDLSNLDTSNVTNMSNMFASCSSLTSLNLSNFNTSKVTNMLAMFAGCSNLTTLDLSSFDTSKVTDIGGMFSTCSSLTTTITIKSSNITNYRGMFGIAATNDGAKITVNYTNETSSLVDQMIATKSENSNVVKGSLVSN